MFAVAGVSGRTGAATADALLKQGEKVRVLVRTLEQGGPWERKHANVAVVDLHDSDAVLAALKGLTGAYLLLPPTPDAVDELAAQATLLTSLTSAVKRAGMQRLVFLSSVGAQHAAGTGPMVALNRAEKALSGLAPSVTFLRASYFLENWSNALLKVIDTGELSHFGHTHLKFAQVCARDVGNAAAKALIDGVPGNRFIELAGKENWSVDDVAEALTSLLGQPVKAVERQVETARATMEHDGATATSAALHAELYQGMARGLFQFARPHQILRGTTSLYDALKPLV